MKLVYYCFKTIFTLLFVIIIFRCNGYAQSYGLGFSSLEVVQDKRTSLDLSPGQEFSFKNNFDVSFEMSYLPSHTLYFGYILRIIEDDTRNFDIVCNTQSSENHLFFVTGNNLTKSVFSIGRDTLVKQWNKLRIKFDFDNDKIILYSCNKSFVEQNLHLKKNAHYKIIFGTNNYRNFEATDVPPMKLRDVRIQVNNVLKYNWPLDEESGVTAREIISQNDAAVNNPVWIKEKHHDWQLAQSLIVNGSASAAFDAKKEIIYIVGTDSLYSYSVTNSKWNDNKLPGKLRLTSDNQSGYNPYNNTLYNFFSDKKLVVKYNFQTHRWDNSVATAKINYWHTSILFSDIDTSAYLFGGYGHHSYKNTVEQYDFSSRAWNTIKAKGDFFMPRYLAALGASAKGDTAYILGGYGNLTGLQIVSPKNTYDMIRFTVKDKTFKKLFELKVTDQDFAFGNSLVIENKSKIYYGLVFPQYKYNSTLQLITGSLTKPDYKLIGSTIPYIFADTRSFADLYYCAESKMFVAITLLKSDSGQTKVNIYTLLSPPYVSTAGTIVVHKNRVLWYVFFAIIIAGIVVLILFKRKQIKREKGRVTQPEPYKVSSSETTEEKSAAIKIFNNNVQLKNSILLFGDLQVFDNEGIDITKYFTPLIKELFLVILIYSIRWGRGLSSEKLNEILWYDKSAKSARNNRSVNIAKLKNLLDKMSHCHLSKETGYWKIDIDYNNLYVDYYNYLNIVKAKGDLDIHKIKYLSAITQRGSFLSNIEYEWLDPFKSEISNEVINTYLHFAHTEAASHDPEFLIELANYIFYFDSVNEDAMIIKCKALFNLGKHSLAKNTFENFSKEYKTIYGEEFRKDFHSILA